MARMVRTARTASRDCRVRRAFRASPAKMARTEAQALLARTASLSRVLLGLLALRVLPVLPARMEKMGRQALLDRRDRRPTASSSPIWALSMSAQMAMEMDSSTVILLEQVSFLGGRHSVRRRPWVPGKHHTDEPQGLCFCESSPNVRQVKLVHADCGFGYRLEVDRLLRRCHEDQPPSPGSRCW